MSNLFGSNPAGGANKAHKHTILRNVSKFYSYVGTSGEVAFLLCEGNMRGAIHDGRTCGGVAHFPLFNPSCDFTVFYDMLDCGEPVVLPLTSSVEAVKTATTVGSAVGQVIEYDITVTNTGETVLTNVQVNDPIAAVTGSPIASLAVGASAVVTASYTLTMADMAAGMVNNQATIVASNPDNEEVTVMSGNAEGNTEPTSTVVTP